MQLLNNGLLDTHVGIQSSTRSCSGDGILNHWLRVRREEGFAKINKAKQGIPFHYSSAEFFYWNIDVFLPSFHFFLRGVL